MNKFLANFIKSLLETKSAKEMHEYLKAILTPEELNMIPKRLEIISCIKKGINHRTIAKKMEVGIATVTRGSNDLKINGKVWQKAVRF